MRKILIHQKCRSIYTYKDLHIVFRNSAKTINFKRTFSMKKLIENVTYDLLQFRAAFPRRTG